MDETKLMQYFGAHGTVECVKVVTDPGTGRSKGYGFVTFADPIVATNVKSMQKVIIQQHPPTADPERSRVTQARTTGRRRRRLLSVV